MVAATIANVNRKVGRDPFVPNDFIPRWGETFIRDGEVQSQQALVTNIKSGMFQLMGKAGKADNADSRQYKRRTLSPI